MEFDKFVEWAFYGVIGSSAVYGVSILSRLNASVNSLNIKIAVILEKIANHEEKIDKLDNRVSKVEKE